MFQPCFGSTRCRLWENVKQESNPLNQATSGTSPVLAFSTTKWFSGDAAALPRRPMIAAASSNAASWICKYSLMVIFGRMQSKFCAFVNFLDRRWFKTLHTRRPIYRYACYYASATIYPNN